MGVLRFPGHKLYRCPGTEDRCIEGRCSYCSGGLALCTVCGGAEGSLPTHCPGERMTNELETAVITGVLDYDIKLGWHPLVRATHGG